MVQAHAGRLGDRAARRPADDLARGLDARQRRPGARGDVDGQGVRRRGGRPRRRPGDPDLRRARRLATTCRSASSTASCAPSASTTARARSTAPRSRAASSDERRPRPVGERAPGRPGAPAHASCGAEQLPRGRADRPGPVEPDLPGRGRRPPHGAAPPARGPAAAQRARRAARVPRHLGAARRRRSRSRARSRPATTRAVLGAPFYLMEAVDGDAIRFELPAGLAGQERARSASRSSTRWRAARDSTRPRSGWPTSAGRAATSSGSCAAGPASSTTRGSGTTPDLDRATDWLRRAPPARRGPGRDRARRLQARQPAVRARRAGPPGRGRRLGDGHPRRPAGRPRLAAGLLARARRGAARHPDPAARDRGRRLPLAAPSWPSATPRALGRTLPDLAFYLALAGWKLAILLEGHWARHVRGTAEGFEFGYLERGGPRLWAWVRRLTSPGDPRPG